jgi:hypothetical protein
LLVKYHKSITRKALSGDFRTHALGNILAANLKQDDLLAGQIGHDEYHYDNNAIAASDRYLEKQRALTISALRDNNPPAAWAAFGRLIHIAQDFYAHSNYVDLWLARFDGQSPHPPSEIAPLMDELIHNPELRSGVLYYPLEILAFIPLVKRIVIPFLPKDSHAHMHLDSPARGERFDYAFEAAVKRTKLEFELVKAELSNTQVALFCEK